MNKKMKATVSALLALVFTGCVGAEGTAARQRILPRTVVVTQTPRHSPLCDLEDYMGGRWSDYPLLMDTRWNKGDTKIARVPLEDFIQQQKIVESYLIDGFAFFPGLGSGRGYLELSRLSPSKMLELPYINFWFNENCDMEAVRQALTHPGQIRHNGKVLLLSYWTQKYFTPEQLKTKLDALRAKFGDTFLFVPDMMRIAYFQHDWRKNGGRLPADKQAGIEETLRQYLRVADGIYFGETHMLHNIEHMERVFFTTYYRDCVIRSMLKVLDEPEFRGKKLLALAAVTGHENNYSKGYQCSHNGTRTLRDSFQTVLAANPDVITLPEWDELNENTCFRPTLYNGFVTRRILRHFMSKLRNLPLSPDPGDDVTVPNLAVSYRKTLAVGDRLSIEVLQIPDGKWRSPMECFVEILSPGGKVLKRFAPQKLMPEKLAEVRFNAGSEEFVAERALQIALSVTWNGKTRRYTGFTPVELRMGTTWDYRWAKHGLRDLLPVKKAKITRNGNFFTVDFESSEPLRSAALNLNGDIVYAHDPVGDVNRFRENAEYAVFAISLIRKDGRNKLFPNAWLSVSGTDDCEWQSRFEDIVRGPRYRFRWLAQSAWKHFLRIPVRAAESAKLHFDLPGVYQGSVDLGTVRREGIYSICGDEGLQLVVSRFLRQPRVPAVLNSTTCRFTAEIPSDIINRTVFFHAVGMNGKVWRSEPIVLEERTQSVKVRVYSSHQDRFVSIDVPGNRIPKLDYDFSPKAGCTLKPANGDRSFFGALGTPVSTMVLRNRAQGTNGDPYKGTAWLAKTKNTIPRQVKLEDGSWALDFKETYAAFPQDLIPTQSGFTIRMEVFPRDVKRRQQIVSTRSRMETGALWGIFLNPGGKVSAEFAGLNFEHTTIAPDLRVVPNKWNKIELRSSGYAMELIVNGKSSGRRGCCYPGRYCMQAVLGGGPGMFFNGMIRNFSVDQKPVE